MKLVQITHSRCDEWSGTSYYFIPDSWTRQQFVEAVDRAQKAYLEAYKEVKERFQFGAPANPGHQPNYSNFPDKTVAEVRDAWQEKKDKYDEWENLRREQQKSFGAFLRQEGFFSFYEELHEYEYEVYWGHRHGERLDYKEEDPKEDVPTAYDLANFDMTGEKPEKGYW